MNIPDAIVKFGTEAVLRYRDAADLAEDDLIPETFFGSFIGPCLYDALSLHSRVEQPYATTIAALDIPESRDRQATRFDGYPNLTLYRDGRPTALIKIKKLSDHENPAKILGEQIRLQNIAGLCGIDAYLGVYVTDDEWDVAAADRIAGLHKSLGQAPAAMSEAVPARSGEWHWRMAAWQVPAG